MDIDGTTRRDLLRLLVGAGALSMASAMTADPRPLLRRAIPSTGEELPVIGLGTWQTFDVGKSTAERADLREVLSRFVQRGARLIDSSPMYGRAESVVGDLAGDLSLRSSLFMATKVWITGREAGVAQMEESLRRLGVKRLDLMQVHNLVDLETHLRTLKQWKDAGRIRYIGITHYTPSAEKELERLIKRGGIDFVQYSYSLADRVAEKRVLPAARDQGVAVIVNQPFASGALFERVRGKNLPPWSGEIGAASWAQFFLKFILGHPAVTCVIPATSKIKHLDDNLDAGVGAMPTEAMRRRMAEHFERL